MKKQKKIKPVTKKEFSLLEKAGVIQPYPGQFKISKETIDAYNDAADKFHNSVLTEVERQRNQQALVEKQDPDSVVNIPFRKSELEKLRFQLADLACWTDGFIMATASEKESYLDTLKNGRRAVGDIIDKIHLAQ